MAGGWTQGMWLSGLGSSLLSTGVGLLGGGNAHISPLGGAVSRQRARPWLLPWPWELREWPGGAGPGAGALPGEVRVPPSLSQQG